MAVMKYRNTNKNLESVQSFAAIAPVVSDHRGTHHAKSSIRGNVWATLVALLLFCSVSPGKAASVALLAVADISGSDTNLDGFFETLFDSADTRLYADYKTFGPGRRNAATEFNISTIPTGAVVVAASLQFTASNATLFNGIDVSGYSGDGVMSVEDLAAGVLITNVHLPSPFFQGVADVTHHVQAVLAAGGRYAGFRLQAPAPVSLANQGASLFSSEASPPPRLSIRYALRPVITEIAFTGVSRRDVAITFQSEAGYQYFFQRAEEFERWDTLLTNITGTGASITLTETNGAGLPKRLYRIGVAP